MKTLLRRLAAISLLLLLAKPAIQAQTPQAPVNDGETLLLLHADQLPLENAGILPLKVEAAAKLTEGRFGKALDIRTSPPLKFSLPLAAQPKRNLTVECWVKPLAESKERLQRLVGRSSNFGFYLSGKNRLTWFVSSQEWAGLNGTVPLNQWTHLAGTFDGTTMRLYLNGKLVGEKKNPGELRRHPSAFFLGTEAGQNNSRFLGLIDEIRISKVARTSFMTGKPIPEPKPTTTFRLRTLPADAFTRSLYLSHTSTPPKLDGVLNDTTWSLFSPTQFVTTRKNAKPKIPTWFKACWDDEALYIAYCGFEKGQETQRLGTSKHDDLEIFKADAIETLLQPGGPGTPYFQIAMNPEGGIFDIKHSLSPKKQIPWDAEGIRFAGKRNADTWIIEAKIPFAALGVPTPQKNTVWKANFCRNEIPKRELSAWSPTGGGFHILERYGNLHFVRQQKKKKDQPAALCELRGKIVDDNGRPISDIPVHCLTGHTLSDCFGEFTLTALPAGEVALKILSPRYHGKTGSVTLRQPLEVMPPLRLEAIDPYHCTFPKPDYDFAWLPSSLEEPPALDTMPGRKLAKLALLATPGEYESRALAFYTQTTLAAPKAHIDKLVSTSGSNIPAEQIQIRWTQRLLKRVQYTRPREDAVWNWRFLWEEAPESVTAGQLRQLVVTVKTTAETPPGIYRGALRLHANQKDIASLPVELEIADLRLDHSSQYRIGAYYGIRGVSEEQQKIEMRDLREHGCNQLIWNARIWYSRDKTDNTIIYNTDAIRHAVQLQKEAGIGPPYLIGTSPLRAADLAGLKREMTQDYAEKISNSAEFRRIYARGIQILQALEKELDAGEFLYTWMDEVLNEGRYETWETIAKITRELAPNRIYITFHNRDQKAVDRIAPWVDVRCYHGHTLDWWQEQGHDWKELGNELQAAKDEAWCYYNIREIAVTSEWVRLCNGYWLWRSPLDGHVPWKYYSYGGSPFDDLDDDRHDFAYAAPHPKRPEMVSTLEWECFREGADDLRYLVTLDNRLAALKGNTHPDVRQARAFRQQLWDFGSRVPDLAERLSGDDYNKRRRQLVDHVLKLNAQLNR